MKLISISIVLLLGASLSQATSINDIKFDYKNGVQYEYEYLLSLYTNESKIEKPSEVNYTVNFIMEFFDGYEGILKIINVKISDNTHNVELDPENNHLTDYYLRFNMTSTAAIEWILTDEREEPWVLNFKRGILSLFTTGFNFDVHGNCFTHYTVTTDPNKKFNIKRKKYTDNCHKLVTETHTNRPWFIKDDILKLSHDDAGSQACNNEVKDNVYTKINCIEKFQLTTNGKKSTTTILQNVRLTATFTRQFTNLETYLNNVSFKANATHTDIFYHMKHLRRPLNDKNVYADCKSQIENICLNFHESFTTHEDLIRFFEAMKVLSFEEMIELEKYSNLCENARRLFIDLLPYYPNEVEARLLMMQLITDEKVSKFTEEEWLTILSHNQNFERQTTTMELAAKMASKSLCPNQIITIGNFVEAYCERWSFCGIETKAVVDFLTSGFIGQFIATEKDRDVLVHSFLAGFYNSKKSLYKLGESLVSVLSDSTLLSYARREAVAVITNKLSTNEAYTLSMYMRYRKDTAELRTLTFQSLINSKEYINSLLELIESEILTPKQTSERINEEDLYHGEWHQTNRYLWSYLCDNDFIKNNADKYDALNSPFYQKLCSNLTLGNGDEKYSHFYKAKGIESSVIYSKKSFVPVNIRAVIVDNKSRFDLTMYNIDEYVESLFQSSDVTSKKKNETKHNYKKQYDGPLIALDFDLFDKKLKHFSIRGDDDIRKLIKVNMSKIKTTLSDNEGAVFKKSGLYSNSEKIRITGAGFPWKTSLVYDYSAKLQMKGKLDIDYFYKYKQLRFDGEILPMFSGGMFTSNSIDAYYTQCSKKSSLGYFAQTPIGVKIDLNGLDDIQITLNLLSDNWKYKLKSVHNIGREIFTNLPPNSNNSEHMKCYKNKNEIKIKIPITDITENLCSSHNEWSEIKALVEKYGFCDYDVKHDLSDKNRNQQIRLKWTKVQNNLYDITYENDVGNITKKNVYSLMVNTSNKRFEIKLMQEGKELISLESDYENEDRNKYMRLKLVADGQRMRFPELIALLQKYVLKGQDLLESAFNLQNEYVL